MTKDAPQMKALKGMIDRVLEPRDDTNYDYTSYNMATYNDFQMFFVYLWKFYLGFGDTAAMIWLWGTYIVFFSWWLE